MEKKNYLVLLTEYCNGFPFSSVRHFNELGDAEQYFDEQRDVFSRRFTSDVETYDRVISDINYLKVFGLDDMTIEGDGFFVGIVTEEEAMTAIMRAVDKSDEMDRYTYVGEYSVKETSVPTLFFNDVEINDDDWDDEYVVPHLIKIIRRPEEEEDTDSNGDYVYDVYVKNHNTSTGDDTIVCDSLECVSEPVFDVLFAELFG